MLLLYGIMYNACQPVVQLEKFLPRRFVVTLRKTTAKLASRDLNLFLTQILAQLDKIILIYDMALRDPQQWNMVPQRSNTLVVLCVISASQICLLFPTEVTEVGGCTIYVTPFKVEQCPPQFQPCCTL